MMMTGTVDNLTFYKMEGAYYVRMKSSLTRKRFFKDAAFEGSRRSSNRLAVGSKLASSVYKSFPEKKRRYSVFCALKSLAIKLLKEQRSEQAVLMQLQQKVRKMERVKRKIKTNNGKFRRTILPSVFMVLPQQQTCKKIRSYRGQNKRHELNRNPHQFKRRRILAGFMYGTKYAKLVVKRATFSAGLSLKRKK